jgi:hypothetical protein
MKKLILALIAAVIFSAVPRTWAYEACVSVNSVTNVVPAGKKELLIVTLAGSNAMYCRFGTAAANAATSTAFDFYLNGLGASWNSPLTSLDANPNISSSRAINDAINCVSSSGAQNVCYTAK